MPGGRTDGRFRRVTCQFPRGKTKFRRSSFSPFSFVVPSLPFSLLQSITRLPAIHAEGEISDSPLLMCSFGRPPSTLLQTLPLMFLSVRRCPRPSQALTYSLPWDSLKSRRHGSLISRHVLLVVNGRSHISIL